VPMLVDLHRDAVARRAPGRRQRVRHPRGHGGEIAIGHRCRCVGDDQERLFERVRKMTLEEVVEIGVHESAGLFHGRTNNVRNRLGTGREQRRRVAYALIEGHGTRRQREAAGEMAMEVAEGRVVDRA